MTNPFRFTGAAREVAGAREFSGAAREFVEAPAAGRRVPLDVVVDLNEKASRANIVRDGREVETPILNPERAATVFENFIPIHRLTEPRSVRQNIAAGTLVSRGTTVDVDFLPPENVVLGLFEGVHADFRTRLVTDVVPLLQDPEVAGVLAKSELTEADRTNLTAKLGGAGVAVDNAVAERSLGAAIAGLRTAPAFR
jgi:hypothetical protein